MIKFKARFFLISWLLFLGLPDTSNGAPHNGDKFELEQPDGSTVPVLVWGDEFYQHIETPDGYTLMRNKKSGWICYAELSADSSELIPTDSVYRYQGDSTVSDSNSKNESRFQRHLKINRSHRLSKHEKVRRFFLNEDDQSKTPAPPASSEDTSAILPLAGVTPITGNYKGLTILIDFSDKKESIPIDSIENFLNKRQYTGYDNNGSVRDYFYDVSGGKVDYQNTVVGYYRAKREKSYYDNSSTEFGLRAQELILEALNWLKNDGFDFTVFSSDSRNNILAVNILYAGSPSVGWSEGLWPHQGNLSSFSANGRYVRKYQISSIGSSLAIATFCHENGHMVFKWPDLYDYGGESYGTGQYCLMSSSGSKNPVPPCAYLRDLAGWDMVTDISNVETGVLFSHIPNSNTSFMYRNKNNSKEMFYIESIRRIGRSKTFPDSGFFIWHVDRNGSNNNEQRSSSYHYLVSLEQADNAFDLERNRNSGSKGDLYRAGYKDRFDDETAPSALWWNGSKSGMKIMNMSGVSDTMTFSVGDLPSTLYSIMITPGAHGSVSPSGKVMIASGGTMRVAVKPDSGYQIDVITINGETVAIVDTLIFDNISSDQTVTIEFGLKAALALVTPHEGEIFYAGDTVSISWRNRGVSVQGFELSYSINGGKTFASITESLSSKDSTYDWIVPEIESDSCIIKIAGLNGTSSTKSGLFAIKKRAIISIADELIDITVDKGKKINKEITVQNSGTGNLVFTATTAKQVDKVRINELSVGADAQAPDAIEIWNGGADIDLGGYQVSWEDNKETSGSYTFPKDFILKSGSFFLLQDVVTDTGANVAYMGRNVQWMFSDFLEMTVTILDPSGLGIDYVKTVGSPDMPPKGTQWLGKGIELCTSFVYRNVFIDSDSAKDWGCSGKGSLKKLNGEWQSEVTKPILTLLSLKGNAAGGRSVTLSAAIDATDLQTGIYEDELVIYHNDPVKPSPLRITCKITVKEPVSVLREANDKTNNGNNPVLLVANNPVQAGQKINLQYIPVGNERNADLYIYNSVGDCLYREKINFKGISPFNRKPSVISWLPRSSNGKQYRRETFLVRLVVRNSDGGNSVFNAKVGVR
ncbi:MAG TPA: M6 family metalloprotease domain-containing protein [Chitinispirillaceae bacterium]|nr:M6 family metalloprotease domain-containing protein [Chitinispirillaceae bacterium]